MVRLVMAQSIRYLIPPLRRSLSSWHLDNYAQRFQNEASLGISI